MPRPLTRCIFSFVPFLAGCGGSGVEFDQPPAVQYEKLIDGFSVSESQLMAYAVDPSTSGLVSLSGTMAAASDDIVIGTYNGQSTNSPLVFVLASGGQLEMFPNGAEYSSAFTLEPAGGNPIFGIIGIPTVNSDMPTSGSATYSGLTTLQITDGTTFFDLNGNSIIVANFVTDSLEVTLNNLQGLRINGPTAPVSVSDVGTLNLSAVDITGGVFSGGTPTWTSSQTSASISGAATTTLIGGFWGPSGTEVGGALRIEDTSGPGVLVFQGYFAGQ